MKRAKILRIIEEEISYQEGLVMEGMTYVEGSGYRNNQLLEVYDNNGNNMLTEGVLDGVQTVLDYAGFIPGIGDFFDAINALIYFVKKKWVMGGLSLVAVIPAVGSIIAAPFKALHKAVGSTLNKVFSKMTTDGKTAANTFLNLLNTGNSKVKGFVKEIYSTIAKNTSKINSFLDKIVPSVDNAIRKASLGWYALPAVFMTAGKKVVGQLKKFFSGLAKGSAYKTSKAAGKSEVKKYVKDLTKTEKEEYNKAYVSKEVDKKKYPTLEDFMIAQEKLKEKKIDAGFGFTTFLTPTMKKKMLEVLKKKEIKLYSTGPAVKIIQKVVGVEQDGEFGKGTERAVKVLQKNKGLAVDGVVGPDTWKKIV